MNKEDRKDLEERVTRPIVGIENRTAQEVFDIMCDRIRRADFVFASRHNDETGECEPVEVDPPMLAKLRERMSDRASPTNLENAERAEMEPKVKRYDLFQVHKCGEERRGEMRPTPDGEWVAHEDYLADQVTERERRERIIEVLKECEAYFFERADAEYTTDSARPILNQEMEMLRMVRYALKKAGA